MMYIYWITALCCLAVLPVMADDFGTRFNDQAPQALEDQRTTESDDPVMGEFDPNAIEPAAGDDKVQTAPNTENAENEAPAPAADQGKH